MSWKLASKINAFGIEYEGKTSISASEFAWARLSQRSSTS
jgi:hypothetical protein